jgi:alpha-L-rhamnosidase
MYRVIAGIDTKTDAPGYKQIVIKPTIGGNLQNAVADYETNYGKISSHWKVDKDTVLLDVEIPPNTTATIYIPAKSGDVVLENGNPLKDEPGIEAVAPGEHYVVTHVGSGVYHFSSAAKK